MNQKSFILLINLILSIIQIYSKPFPTSHPEIYKKRLEKWSKFVETKIDHHPLEFPSLDSPIRSEEIVHHPSLFILDGNTNHSNQNSILDHENKSIVRKHSPPKQKKYINVNDPKRIIYQKLKSQIKTSTKKGNSNNTANDRRNEIKELIKKELATKEEIQELDHIRLRERNYKNNYNAKKGFVKKPRSERF